MNILTLVQLLSLLSCCLFDLGDSVVKVKPIDMIHKHAQAEDPALYLEKLEAGAGKEEEPKQGSHCKG